MTPPETIITYTTEPFDGRIYSCPSKALTSANLIHAMRHPDKPPTRVIRHETTPTTTAHTILWSSDPKEMID